MCVVWLHLHTHVHYYRNVCLLTECASKIQIPLRVVDVKKDEFGKWNYSGSHVFHYRSERTPEGDLEFERVLSGVQGSNVFQLRRIHCKHPSNPNFQRLLAFVTGTYVEFFSVHVCVYVHAQLLLKSQLPYSVLYCTVLYCGSTF